MLELCRGDPVTNLHNIQKQLDHIHVCGAEVSSTQHMVRKNHQKTTTKKTSDGLHKENTENTEILILINFSKMKLK